MAVSQQAPLAKQHNCSNKDCLNARSTARVLKILSQMRVPGMLEEQKALSVGFRQHAAYIHANLDNGIRESNKGIGITACREEKTPDKMNGRRYWF